MLKLQWHCGFTTAIKSSPYGDYEIECGCEFETMVDEEELEDGYIIGATCPCCGARLNSEYDEFEIVED